MIITLEDVNGSIRFETLKDLHLEQLYEDSQEVVLAIRFDSTCDIAAYKLGKAHNNSDYAGGADRWDYAPTERSMETVSKCKKTRVMGFNI
jgi:heme-degrading monooxygenase HmoA